MTLLSLFTASSMLINYTHRKSIGFVALFLMTLLKSK